MSAVVVNPTSGMSDGNVAVRQAAALHNELNRLKRLLQWKSQELDRRISACLNHAVPKKRAPSFITAHALKDEYPYQEPVPLADIYATPAKQKAATTPLQSSLKSQTSKTTRGTSENSRKVSFEEGFPEEDSLEAGSSPTKSEPPAQAEEEEEEEEEEPTGFQEEDREEEEPSGFQEGQPQQQEDEFQEASEPLRQLSSRTREQSVKFGSKFALKAPLRHVGDIQPTVPVLKKVEEPQPAESNPRKMRHHISLKFASPKSQMSDEEVTGFDRVDDLMSDVNNSAFEEDEDEDTKFGFDEEDEN